MKIEQDPLSPLFSPIFAADNHSLVKQLATSKPKHITMNTEDPSCVVVVDGNVAPNQSLRKQAQQHYKKHVKRRLHTSRPYQERLLNMAEARREIATALKYHREAMKQASEEQQKQQLQHHQQQQQQQQQQSLSLQPSHLSSFDQDERFKSRRNPRIYPSCTTKISSYMDEFSYSSSFSSHPPPSPPVPNPYSNINLVTSSFAHPPPKAENPNFTLPDQTLGLNLNLHHFKNLESTHFLDNNNYNNNNTSPISSSSQLSVVTDQDVRSIGISHSQGEGVSSVVDTIKSKATIQTGRGLHTAMDDEGMEEIKSLGEQHQMEWNDTMSLVTSAWWFNCLKNMEHEVKNEDGAYHIFDELNEFPTWLNNANERCLEQCSEDYFQDYTLPW